MGERPEDWMAGMAEENLREFAAKQTGPAELEEYLKNAAEHLGSVTGDEVVAALGDLVSEADRAVLHGDYAGHVAGSAATIGLVAPKVPDEHVRESIQYDLGQATMTIMLAAADLGIGSGHAWVKDQEQAQKVLGFPDDRFLGWLIALGYPADGPLKPIKELKRRPFDEVVHRGRW